MIDRFFSRGSILLRVVIGVTVVTTAMILHHAAGLHLPEAAYETVRLFFLDGNLEVGKNFGGIQAFLLWSVRWVAPLLTVGVLFDVLVALGAVTRLPRRFRGHVVIAGGGRLGQALCLALREGGQTVVLIERDADDAALAELRHRGVMVVLGDAGDARVQERAHVPRARFLIAVAHEDIVNLNIACTALRLVRRRTGSKASSRAQGFCAYAHVYDLSLKRDLDETLTQETANGVGRVAFLNVYEMAAEALRREGFLTDLGPDTLLVLVGLGRLGASLLRSLLGDAADSAPGSILVIDREPRRDKAGFGDRVAFLQADVRDPKLWEEISPRLRAADAIKVLVCTDDDLANLGVALEFLNRVPGHPHLEIWVRLFQEVSLLEEDVGVLFHHRRECRIVPLLIWKAMCNGMPAELSCLLLPASSGDGGPALASSLVPPYGT
jgi:Trk K+ transport system NAD-binding subunit